MKKLLPLLFFVVSVALFSFTDPKSHAVFCGKQDSQLSIAEISANRTLHSSIADETIASFVMTWKSSEDVFVDHKVSGNTITDEIITQLSALPAGTKVFIEQVKTTDGTKIAGTWFVIR